VKSWISVLAFAALASGIYALREATKLERSSRSHTTAAAEPEAPAPVRIIGLAPVATSPPVRALPAGSAADQRVVPAAVDATEDHAGPGSPPTGEEMRDRLEAAFVAEPPAPSSEAAQTLEHGVRAALPAGSQLRRVECRASLCRIEIEHAAVDDHREFLQRAFLAHDSTRASSGPVFASPPAQAGDGDPMVAVIFVGREGTALPMLGSSAPGRP
jgi:hypothetical protein